MDKKSKILLVIFSLLIVVSVYMTYVEYLVKENFQYFTDAESVPGPGDIMRNFLNI